MDYRAVAQKVYDDFDKGDVESLLAIVDPQVEWREAENGPYWPGHPFVGPDSVVSGVFARIPQDFKEFTIEIHRLVAVGTTVLMEGRYKAIHTASGRALDADAAHVWDFDGERMIRFQQYTDTWQWRDIVR